MTNNRRYHDTVNSFILKLSSEKALSPITSKCYRGDIESFFKFVSTEFEEVLCDHLIVNVKNIKLWMRHLKLSGMTNSSVARHISSIKSFARFLRNEVIITSKQTEKKYNEQFTNKAKITNNDFTNNTRTNNNYIETKQNILNSELNIKTEKSIKFIQELNNISKIKAPKFERPLPKGFNNNMIMKIASCIDEMHKDKWQAKRDFAAIMLMYCCGLRISETLSISTNNIIDDFKFIKVKGKGNKERIIPLIKIVADSIIDYIKICPFPVTLSNSIFVGSRGGKQNPGTLQRTIRKIRITLELSESLVPHAFRHSFATQLLSNGADIRSIQELLGHSNLSTTQIYTKVDTKRLSKYHKTFHPRGN